MNVLVIGGCGDFGSFYATLLKKEGHLVFIDGRNKDEVKRQCLMKGFVPFDDNYSKIEVVLISVPNNVAPKIVVSVAKLVKKETLLLDVCSVKSEVVKELEKLKKKNLELISVHPMHGPRVNSISGYPVIIIPIKTGIKSQEIISIFKKEKANIVESTAKEHDSILSLVQGLTHYSQFISASTIKELGIDLKKAKKFSSPNFDLFLSLMSRVVLQNPNLYSEIQLSNPFNKKMRAIFSKKAIALEKVANKKNPKILANKIIESAQIFNSSAEILHESDRAVSALKFVENILKENIGKKFLLENSQNKHQHYGRLISVNANELILEENNSTTSLNISKIKLCTKSELMEWKKINIQEKTLDYSFLVSKTGDKITIENAFKWIKEAKIAVTEEFESNKFPAGQKSVTIKVTFFIDDNKDDINEKISKTIDGLGFTRR